MYAMEIAAALRRENVKRKTLTLRLPDNMNSELSTRSTRSTYSNLEIFSGDREYNIFLANNAK